MRRRRRRAKPTKPAQAAMSPGRPAPTIGPGTVTPTTPVGLAPSLLGVQVPQYISAANRTGPPLTVFARNAVALVIVNVSVDPQPAVGLLLQSMAKLNP